MILTHDIIGLDLGTQRTGVARLHPVAKIAEALPVIDMQATPDLVVAVQALVEQYGAEAVVAGLPRGLEGQTTKQTSWAQAQIDELEVRLQVPVFAIDEAGSSKKAAERIHDGEVLDSVAAGILLEDFIGEVARGAIDGVSL